MWTRMTISKKLGHHKKQFSLFAVVGIFNTFFDFTTYNILIFIFGFAAVVANVFSASLAMMVSFVLNKKYVFSDISRKNTKHQFALFVVITAIGIYVIQSSLIAILTAESLVFHDVFIRINSLLPQVFDDQFVVVNGAKAVATVGSLLWNYVMYAKFVFNK